MVKFKQCAFNPMWNSLFHKKMCKIIRREICVYVYEIYMLHVKRYFWEGRVGWWRWGGTKLYPESMYSMIIRCIICNPIYRFDVIWKSTLHLNIGIYAWALVLVNFVWMLIYCNVRFLLPNRQDVCKNRKVWDMCECVSLCVNQWILWTHSFIGINDSFWHSTLNPIDWERLIVRSFIHSFKPMQKVEEIESLSMFRIVWKPISSN